MSSIKPCPWCGGTASVSVISWRELSAYTYDVGCKAKDCPVRPMGDVEYGTAEEAVKAWNTRYNEKEKEKAE